ncbi:hypothetical protein SOVF_009610 [Spinacia oleracea]|nr:hypothetical protein SOVF_009610 [Spinacia oleracea]
MMKHQSLEPEATDNGGDVAEKNNTPDNKEEGEEESSDPNCSHDRSVWERWSQRGGAEEKRGEEIE